MKTFGILDSQTLVTLPVDNQGLPIIHPPVNASSDWKPPTFIPLIKESAPSYNSSTHKLVPRLLWEQTQVKRQWDITPLSTTELDNISIKSTKISQKQTITDAITALKNSTGTNAERITRLEN